jgi:hypothetical protein
MKDSKVKELLKALSSNEFKKFGDFVRSPFFNKNTHIISLYDYFSKYSENFDKMAVLNEDIFRFVFRNEKYSEIKVRILLSNFGKLIEEYLVYLAGIKNVIYQKTLLVNTLHQRNLTKNFRSALKETMEYQEKQFNRDEDYYYNQIYLEVEAFNHFLERSTKINEDDFEKIGDNIDLYFILTKLNLLHFMYLSMRRGTEAGGERMWLMDEIISYIETNLIKISKEHPIIYMKYLILMTMMKSSEVKYFRRLKKFVIDNHNKLSQNVLSFIFTELQNYTHVRCNGPDPGFRNERFSVYKMMEERASFNKSKNINYIDFLNAILSALEVNKFAWADNFFSKYQDRILPELQESAINLAKTQIFFYKKKYDEALDMLNNVSYNNNYFYLQSKKILAKIYYEKKEYEPITYIIDTTRHYLKRNTGISRINWELFNKFFHYLKKMTYLEPKEKEKISNTIEALKKENNVSSKDWLLKKLEELENE